MDNLPVPIHPKSKIEELRYICRFIDGTCPYLLSYQKQLLIKIALNRDSKVYVTFPRFSGRRIYLDAIKQIIDILNNKGE